MSLKRITIPAFKKEADEAACWDANPDVATALMSKALKAGTARRKIPLQTVTIRLPVKDLTIAKANADRKGLPYQTYIKMILHSALEKDKATG